MSLIDVSYFVGNLNVPNTGDSAIAETVNWFIGKYEAIFLQKALGYPLYKAYLAAPDDQRFLDIINGKEYTDHQGYTAKWNGLIEIVVPGVPASGSDPEVPAQKESIIANFVYYWYQRYNVTQTTGIGEIRTEGENAIIVSPRKKMVSAWNEIHSKMKTLLEFIDANQTAYPEWTYVDRNAVIKYFGFINPIF
jgi:hypothetical protein